QVDHVFRWKNVSRTVSRRHPVQHPPILFEWLHTPRIERSPAHHPVAVAGTQDLAESIALEELALEQVLDGVETSPSIRRRFVEIPPVRMVGLAALPVATLVEA